MSLCLLLLFSASIFMVDLSRVPQKNTNFISLQKQSPVHLKITGKNHYYDHIVVYLNFVTFSKDLIDVFMLWFCSAFS